MRVPILRSLGLALLALGWSGTLPAQFVARSSWDEAQLKQREQALAQELADVQQKLQTAPRPAASADNSVQQVPHVEPAVDQGPVIRLPIFGGGLVGGRQARSQSTSYPATMTAQPLTVVGPALQPVPVPAPQSQPPQSQPLQTQPLPVPAQPQQALAPVAAPATQTPVATAPSTPAPVAFPAPMAAPAMTASQSTAQLASVPAQTMPAQTVPALTGPTLNASTVAMPQMMNVAPNTSALPASTKTLPAETMFPGSNSTVTYPGTTILERHPNVPPGVIIQDSSLSRYIDNSPWGSGDPGWTAPWGACWNWTWLFGGCGQGCAVPSETPDPCPCCGPSVYLFGASDGWAQDADGGLTNNFGKRFGINAGIPLVRSVNLGFQAGASFGLYDWHGHPQGLVGPVNNQLEVQTFLTTGLFHRASLQDGDLWSMAAVYDHQFHDGYSASGVDYIDLGQLRGLIGFAWDPRNEFGTWVAIGLGEQEPINGGQTAVTSVNQYNFYWRHHWEYGTDTMLYAGIGDGHNTEWILGANGLVPLGRRWSAFASAHYMAPSRGAGAGASVDPEEIWNLSVGMAFHFRPLAREDSVTRSRDLYLPLLPVADNGSFALRTTVPIQ